MYMHIISCTILLLAFYFTVCYAFQALFLFVSLVFRWSCLFVCLLLHAFALLIFLLFFLVSFRFYFRFSVVFFFVLSLYLFVCLFAVSRSASVTITMQQTTAGWPLQFQLDVQCPRASAFSIPLAIAHSLYPQSSSL